MEVNQMQLYLVLSYAPEQVCKDPIISYELLNRKNKITSRRLSAAWATCFTFYTTFLNLLGNIASGSGRNGS